MMLAKRSRDWPALALPDSRGAMTARDVMATPEGVERDGAIDTWCAAVWAAYRDAAPSVRALATAHGLDAWTAE
jgi:hypothetical protein